MTPDNHICRNTATWHNTINWKSLSTFPPQGIRIQGTSLLTLHTCINVFTSQWTFHSMFWPFELRQEILLPTFEAVRNVESNRSPLTGETICCPCPNRCAVKLWRLILVNFIVYSAHLTFFIRVFLSRILTDIVVNEMQKHRNQF